MKKYLSRTLVMLLVIAMSATQLLLPAFATTEAYDCICDAATREGVCIGSYQPTCGDFGYDLYVCDACGGNYAILTAITISCPLTLRKQPAKKSVGMHMNTAPDVSTLHMPKSLLPVTLKLMLLPKTMFLPAV